MTQGSRKLIVTVLGFILAATVKLTETQADVILGLAYAMMGVNAVEHIGGAIGQARLRTDGSTGSSGRASGSEE